MNHQSGVKKIGKDSKHRRAMMRNLASDLFRHEYLVTTTAKGKMLKAYAEGLIERAKKDSLHNRRMAFRDIRDTAVLKKLFENIGKRYQNRAGGYTRLLHLGMRKGDAAESCRVELVEELLKKGKEAGGGAVTDVKAQQQDKPEAKGAAAG